jgi:large subunit ribosomal protein L10
MLRQTALCAALASAAAFAPVGPAALPTSQSSAARSSLTSLHMGKNIFQKKEIIKGVKSDLENAQLIFSTEMSEMNIKQLNSLRSGLPDGSKAMCVKNRLLKRVISGTQWEPAGEVASGTTNMWIIVNDDVKGTIEHFNKWKKDNKKEAGITAGVIEGVLYDAKGVEAIGKLPSKLELYAQIAGSIQAVPAKLAGTVKEVPQKTARAVKLAICPDQ